MTNDLSDYTLSWVSTKTKSKIFLRCERDGKTIYSDEVRIQADKPRREVINKLGELGCDRATVENELLSIANEYVTTSSGTIQQKPIAGPHIDKMDLAIVEEAKDILENNPSILEIVYQDAESIGVVGEECTVLTLFLAGVSRLLLKPMSIIVQGETSSGKSHIVESAARLFPDETKLVSQSMTPNSLYYLPPNSLKHKIVVAGERSRIQDDERAEATRALREMLSSGELRKLVPYRGPNGKLLTQVIHQDGPITFWESTTLGQIFDEDRNRCVLIHTDESAEQTRRILLALAKGTSQKTIARQHAIQRMLQTHSVVIPYAESLALLLPSERIESRRAFSHLLGCIRSSALLHQFQREKSDGCIVANENDYATAYALLSGPMTESIGSGVSEVESSFFEWIARWFPDRDFCVQDLLNRNDCPKGKDRTYTLVNKLKASKCLSVVPSHSKAKMLRIGRPPTEAVCPLPSPHDLFSQSTVGSSDDGSVCAKDMGFTGENSPAAKSDSIGRSD